MTLFEICECGETVLDNGEILCYQCRLDLIKEEVEIYMEHKQSLHTQQVLREYEHSVRAGMWKLSSTIRRANPDLVPQMETINKGITNEQRGQP